MSSFSPDDRETTLRVLQSIADDPDQLNDDERFKTLVAKIYKSARRKRRKEIDRDHRSHDRQIREHTERCLSEPAFDGEPPKLDGKQSLSTELRKAARCYICKQSYFQLHHRYHMLCPECAEDNEAKRNLRTDLEGRIALLTGGRVKIGKEVGLKLLRDGARVIVTTRFPENAQLAYEQEDDSDQWIDRLKIVGLDLRNIPEVERFADALSESETHLDILINNAAQTIKRPLDYYRDLLETEHQPALLEATGEFATNLLQGEQLTALFPPGEVDHEGQPIDLRETNSWRQTVDSVRTDELLEVHLVNAIAPFILTGRLKNMLDRSIHERRFIVNVSAMEGQFGRDSKTEFHPHTNMAKAGLNMLTRTSAKGYAEQGIFMNSVDTGWITQEQPHPVKVRLRQSGFVPPLDIIDGASRIYAPIVDGLNNLETPVFGAFLKDYRPYPW